MGGSISSRARNQDSSSDASTCLPSTSKSPKPAKKSISRLKLSFKRKTTSRDRTRPFQDLIKSWPAVDFDLLLAEFEADSRLLDIQKTCDLARKSIPQREILENMVEKWKNDLKNGDLVIEVMDTDRSDEATPSTSTYEIRCSSTVASSQSPLIHTLLHRKMVSNPPNPEEPQRICFDEHIFPRAFAQMFVFFLYTETIDWQLISLEEISVSSLSLAKAITSGRNPNVQLWKSLQIIQVARFFGVEGMVRACEDIVVRLLSPDNVVSVLQWSLENTSKYIQTHSIRLLEQQFSKISLSNSLFDLEKEEMCLLTGSQFLQTTELELLEACVRWGEHALLKKLEDREPNVVADTCHSISRRGIKRSEMDSEELRKILAPLTANIRKEYALPPFDKSLNEAYSRGILEREPLRNDLVSSETREINPDLHWLKPDPLSPGPRYYRPYHEVLLKNSSKRDSIGPSGFSCPSGTSPVDSLDLEFHNFYPEILENSMFLMAQESIKQLVEEFDVKSLPRRYHQNSALEIITRRVLIELDISEECFDCHLATGKSTPPDVLPTGIYDIF